MSEDVIIEMMSARLIVWRCLHGGPLTAQSLDQWPTGDGVPWADFRARNLPLLSTLTEAYGACAVVARGGDAVVGHLRFYPKAVCTFAAGGAAMCLQQKAPYGPPDNAGGAGFPPMEQLPDKTLFVHCLMLARAEQGRPSYRRRGIATRMARALIQWATEKGWRAVEATAYEDLDTVYATTGAAGKSFWQKLAFRITEQGTEAAFEDYPELLGAMVEEGRARGLSPEDVKRKYTMRLDLP